MNRKQITAAASIVKALTQFVRDDQAATYPLEEPVAVTLRSERAAAIVKSTYTTDDLSLTVSRISDTRIRIAAGTFPREALLWNGPDVIGNRQLRSMLASLFHDLIWGHRAELAREWDCSEETILKWGNDVLFLVWKWASKDSWWGRREAWLAFQATSFAVPWYHRAKAAAARLLSLCALSALLAGCSGCYSLPDGEVENVEGVDAVRAVMDKWGDGLAPLGD